MLRQPASYTSPALSSAPPSPSDPLCSYKLGHPWHCLYLDVPSATLPLPHCWASGFHHPHRTPTLNGEDQGLQTIWKFYVSEMGQLCIGAVKNVPISYIWLSTVESNFSLNHVMCSIARRDKSYCAEVYKISFISVNLSCNPLYQKVPQCLSWLLIANSSYS